MYPLEEKQNRKIFTVTELNQTVRNLLEETFPLIWIEGEISNLVQPSSGHIYFSIKDEASQVRCAMFKGRNRALSFTPENGMQVLMRVSVSLYPGRGDYQLIVEYMEEAGDGILKRRFEELKQKLFAQGLFSQEHKKTLPLHPKQIGVITSSTGAAIRDILSVLKRRFPLLPVIIYPSLVQGTQAAANIVKQIQLANKRQECDVLILARGGGSLEDLWPFNEEVVANAIFASNIPIVVGVGHEIDVTIADFVADLRAPTPSAAAELVSPDQYSYLEDLAFLATKFEYLITRQIHELKEKFSWLQKRLRHPKQALREKEQRIDLIEEKLMRLIKDVLASKVLTFKQLTSRLDSVSPLATLNRGYSILTTPENAVISSIKAVDAGDIIHAKLSDGVLKCEVLERSK